MGKTEVEAFLTYLAVEKQVSASTQSQAKAALLFLYQKVLQQEVEWLTDVVAAKQPQHMSTVLTIDEVRRLLFRLEGEAWLIAFLLYGSGLRILEACKLRILDLDFTMHQLLVRSGKGAKDRITMIPTSLIEPLRSHLELVRLQHQRDCEQGGGEVYLPFALDRKYPGAAREWKWQYAFPAARMSLDPRSGALRRHH